MQGGFRTALFGYDKRQVNVAISKLTREHEDALLLKNERFVQLRDENNILRAELARYRAMEQEISSVMITARMAANGIIQDGEKSAHAEKERLEGEVRSLEALACALHDKLSETIQQAEDISRGFGKELDELLMRKEAFLKATYGFERREGEEAVWRIRI